MHIQFQIIELDNGKRIIGILAATPGMQGDVVKWGTSEIMDMDPDTPISVAIQRAQLSAEEAEGPTH